MRMAFRAVLLSLALISYGAVPSTGARISEVESETQQETNPSTVAHHEDRRGSRQVSLWKVVLGRILVTRTATPSSLAARFIDASLNLSAGLTIPLRC